MAQSPQPPFERAQWDHYILEWRVIGQELEVRMSAQTQGWVGVGFEPTRQMEGANILIGYVDGTNVIIEDHFGHGRVAHRADTRQGGRSDVRLIEGSQFDGRTTIHFAIPLNSGDTADTVIRRGSTVTVIYAWGPDRGGNNLTARHPGRGTAQIRVP